VVGNGLACLPQEHGKVMMKQTAKNEISVAGKKKRAKLHLGVMY
jgi:hypothetical protein